MNIQHGLLQALLGFALCLCTLSISPLAMADSIGATPVSPPQYLLNQVPPETSRRARRPADTPRPPLFSSRDHLRVDRSQARPVLAGILACDTSVYANSSGQALVNAVKNSQMDCLWDLYSISGGQGASIFPEAKMVTIASAMGSDAIYYPGNNSQQMLQLITFLRAGYYVQYYNRNEIGDYGTPLANAIGSALISFRNNSHFLDVNEDHGEILSEFVTLIDSSEQNANHIDTVRTLLNAYNPVTWGNTWYPVVAVNNVYTVLFRGHQLTSFRDAVQNPANVGLFDDLVSFVNNNKNADIGTDREFLLRNAGSELARFLMSGTGGYPATFHQYTVHPRVLALLNQFSMTGWGSGIYIQMAGNIEYYDHAHCADFGLCNFANDLEDLVLPAANARTCSPTLRVRSQALTEAQMDWVCDTIAQEEVFFHDKIGSNPNDPVANDYNTQLEMVIFHSSSDYETYAGTLFGIDTNNGGMYLEGDPSAVGNQPRFIAYEAEWERPAFDVWNLTHEYVHYLDGRFIWYGPFSSYPMTAPYSGVWFFEGFGEYMSYTFRNLRYDSAVAEAANPDKFTLAQVFDTVYTTDYARTYQWGYMAVRFMFERHLDDVNNMIAVTRLGQYDSGYRTWLDSIRNSYNTEFREWVVCFRAGNGDTSSCGGGTTPTNPKISVTPGNLSANVAQGASASRTLTIANTGGGSLSWSVVEEIGGREPANDDPAQRLSVRSGKKNAPFRHKAATVPAAASVQDGGFEAGWPNPYWNDFSDAFGSVLCTYDDCGLGGGTGPRSGYWWVWFGGIDQPETGYARQNVTIPAGTSSLSFWLEVPLSSGDSGDYMTLSIDGNELFRVTGSTASAYASYQQMTVDVSSFADGDIHTLSFDSSVNGSDITNFFIDDVAFGTGSGGGDDNCVADNLPWLSVSPSSGTTAGGATSNVTVSFNTTGLLQGTYSGQLCVASNDSTQPRVRVPVSLTVSEDGGGEEPPIEDGRICRSLNHALATSYNGTQINWETGAVSNDQDPLSGTHFNPYNEDPYGAGKLMFAFPNSGANSGVVNAAGNDYLVLASGAVIGPDANFSFGLYETPTWRAGADGYLGFRFACTTASQCYGYARLTTTGPNGFPGTLGDYCYQPSGEAITIGTPAPTTFTVTPSVGTPSGTISPSSPQSVVAGATPSFTLNPASGFEIDRVDGTCGGLLNGASFTTTPVSANCTVVAHFKAASGPITFTVTPSVGSGNGSISPSTPQSVVSGTSTSFTLAPASGHEIDSVSGSCGGSLSGTTFFTNAVSADCTVIANFRAVESGSNGIIVSGLLAHEIMTSATGTSINIVTSALNNNGPLTGNWDFNFRNVGGLTAGWVMAHNPMYLSDGAGRAMVLQSGDTVGPAHPRWEAEPSLELWRSGVEGYLGVTFDCNGRLTWPVASPGRCYGYIHFISGPNAGFPAMILDTAFDGDGNPIMIPDLEIFHDGFE